MSLSVEKLSLLGSLAPLRQKPDGHGIQQENGFSNKLDKALGGGDSPASTAGGNARELAESLTLQMLQSSLSLAGDSPSESTATPGVTPFSSTHVLMEAYRANLSAGGERSATPSAVPRRSFRS